MVWVGIVVIQGMIVSLVDSSFMFAMHFGIFGYHRTFLKSLNTFLNFKFFFSFFLHFSHFEKFFKIDSAFQNSGIIISFRKLKI